MKKHKKCMDFLESHKHLAGLSDYSVIFALEDSTDDDFAEVDVNIFEKTVKIQPTKKFWKQDWKRQKNILLHELWHGRISVYNDWIEKVTNDLEEDLVNDIVRGFERHKEL